MDPDEIAGIDDDAGDAGDGRPPEDDDAGHVCPDCGETFTTSSGLGLHRKRAHGVEGRRGGGGERRDSSPRRATSGSSTGRQSARKRLVAETLLELLDTTDELRGRRTGPAIDLADQVRADVDRIAEALAGIAERLPPLGTFIDRTMGRGGPLSWARAFLPTMRQLGRKLRDLAERRRAAALEWQMEAGLTDYRGQPPAGMLPDGTGPFWLDEDGQPTDAHGRMLEL